MSDDAWSSADEAILPTKVDASSAIEEASAAAEDVASANWEVSDDAWSSADEAILPTKVDASSAIEEASSGMEVVRESITVWMVEAGDGATMTGVRVTAPMGTEALDGRLREVV